LSITATVNGQSGPSVVATTGDTVTANITAPVVVSATASPASAPGATGPQGPQGVQGVKGDTGAAGATGAKGDTGSQGPTGPAGPSYTLPTASSSTLGGVKIGSGLSIESGVLSSTATGGGIDANDTIDGGFFYGQAATIAITSQPSNQTASSGAATFSVSASISPSGTLGYQWQKSDGGGLSFAQQTLPVARVWTNVAYGNGTYVAVSGGDSSVAATSTDGINWTQQALPYTGSWRVVFGGGVFVAVNWNSTNTNNSVITSTNGSSWTQRTVQNESAWYDIAYNGTVFCAVSSSANRAMTSPDGATWTTRSIGSESWSAVSYGNGLFVAVPGLNSQARPWFATSTDGATWTSRNIGSSQVWRSVVYGDGLWVAIAENTTTYATSTNGTDWTIRTTLPSASNWQSVAYGNGQFVLFSFYTLNGGGTPVAVSSDGINWTTVSMPVSAGWVNVMYGGSKFVAVSQRQTGNVNASNIAVTSTGSSAFANVSGATASTLALTGLTNAADNGDQYRVLVASTGATTVTSNPATLTVS